MTRRRRHPFLWTFLVALTVFCLVSGAPLIAAVCAVWAWWLV